MAERYFRAVDFSGAGFIHQTGDAVVGFALSDSEELQLAFPGDDIPILMLLLSQVYAQNITGKGVRDSLSTAIPVESAQFQRELGEEAILCVVDLSSGAPVSLALPHPIAAQMRDQLNEILG